MNTHTVELELPRPWPRHVTRGGRFIRLEPLDAERHATGLFEASHGSEEADRIWTYLPYGPFASPREIRSWLALAASRPDPQFYAIVDLRNERPAGVCSFLRIEPAHAVIEVGHIWFAPHLQRTTGATEAMYLLFSHVFDELGYRRLEWKCNAANAASRSAAERLGFTFEGVFRQHLVVKGRNRDSAWFSLLDKEWPVVRAGMEEWLGDGNQTVGSVEGQTRSLAVCIARFR